MTLKLITSEKAIMAAAKALNGAGAKVADQTHLVLCSALGHAKEHGNTTVIDHVVEQVHTSANIRGVDAFIRAFTNLRKRPDPKTAKVAYRKPKNEALKVDLDAAMKSPYWNMPEVLANNRPIVFDVEGRLLSFIGQVRKHIADGTVKDKKAATNVLKTLEADAKSLKLDLSSVPSMAEVKAAVKQDNKPDMADAAEKVTQAA